MKISVKKTKTTAKTAVVFLSKDKEKNLPDSLKAYKNMIESLFKDGLFKGNKKTSFFVPLSPVGSSYKYLLLMGLGNKRIFGL